MTRVGIRGYTDAPSYAPGETVRFYVSSDSPGTAEASLVRLVHGDPTPGGPGVKELPADQSFATTFDAVHQRTQVGSYAQVPAEPGALLSDAGFGFHVFAWSGVPAASRQVLASRRSDVGTGWELALEGGVPTFEVRTDVGSSTVRGVPLFPEVWYSIAVSLDAAAGSIHLDQQQVVNSVNSRISTVVDLDPGTVDHADLVGDFEDAGDHLVLAATVESREDDRLWMTDLFSGKLDGPAVFAGPITAELLSAVRSDELDPAGTLGCWDFGHPDTVATDEIRDVSGHGRHGFCVNQPDRAMTGWNWRGEEEHFTHAPDEYGALWFHADSLDDCRWNESLTWTVPEDLRSGAYALSVTQGDAHDQIPFFVVPPRGEARSKILVLMPTFSYLAYANSQVMQNAVIGQLVMGVITVLEDIDLELHESDGSYGLSTYDYHLDGRGVSYSTWRRPILNMRPRYRHEFGSVWQFPADLHLIDWLEAQELEYDIATDHDLQAEGSALLERYNVVVTGTHPEYYSGQMLDAWETYLARGGRGMYLAGNGFYWVASQHPAKPWVIEVRKGETGDQAWRARPGELFHSTTGERGGLWRMRARAPQKLFGTGYGSHGLDRSAGYVQLPDASDERIGWIMEGIDPDSEIGDFGLVNGGASGLEMDHIDYALGTPPNTLLLASSRGHSANALVVPEDQYFAHAGMNGLEDPLVRADVVYFTTRAGGGVFSTSSMAWCGSLSYDDYDNNVSRMTGNVLRRFAEDEPLEPIE